VVLEVVAEKKGKESRLEIIVVTESGGPLRRKEGAGEDARVSISSRMLARRRLEEGESARPERGSIVSGELMEPDPVKVDLGGELVHRAPVERRDGREERVGQLLALQIGPSQPKPSANSSRSPLPRARNETYLDIISLIQQPNDDQQANVDVSLGQARKVLLLLIFLTRGGRLGPALDTVSDSGESRAGGGGSRIDVHRTGGASGRAIFGRRGGRAGRRRRVSQVVEELGLARRG
jgi:hypothetical protein